MQQQILEQIDCLNDDLDRLITITYAEIEIVKSARHADLDKYQHEKQALLQRFERNKEELNRRLLALTQQHSGLSLEEVLDETALVHFEEFKTKLAQLHEANRIYGTFVATLGEFFNSLVSAILPMKEEGYKRETPRPAAFLQVSA